MTVQNPSAADPVWDRLLAVAREELGRAYCPYSSFPVGAAALTDDGRVVSGANIENAAYGVTLCAECSLVSDLFRTGGGKLTAFACVSGSGEVLMPCGRCRQLLYEHRAESLAILTPQGVKTMDEILPMAFGPQDLAEQ